MRLVFPYLAQAHQVLHSLPIAAALAERYRDVEVHVAAVSESRLRMARDLVARHAPNAPLIYDLLPLGPADGLRLRMGCGATHFKQYTLLRNRRYFGGFDAVITPERTSLFLRRIGVRAKLIWTRHGAGDREIGFAPDVRHFDFVLMAGRKIEQRLLAEGLIAPGRYVSGVYAKFDWNLPTLQQPLFDNDRPTVLYCPHFKSGLSSWHRFGPAVLASLAHSTRFNLIFAPHVRLFDPPTAAARRMFEDYATAQNIHIDLGSERSVDMSYTRAADLYLGDVSSQVAEFVQRPRPCAFIDAHRRQWQNDPNYRFWSLGPVLTSPEHLEDRLAQAIQDHPRYHGAQRRYMDETFSLEPGPTAPRGADAIIEFMLGTRSGGCIGQAAKR